MIETFMASGRARKDDPQNEKLEMGENGDRRTRKENLSRRLPLFFTGRRSQSQALLSSVS